MKMPRTKQAGFSSLEALVATGISLSVFGAAASFFTAQQHAVAVQQTYAKSQNVTRTAVDLMARELRMASFDPSGAALALSPGPTCPGVRQGLLEAMPGKIRFQQDLNGDGDVTDSGEDVTYDRNGTSIRRQDGANQPISLVTGVPSNGLSFQYYDGSNPPVELVPASAGPGGTPALTATQRNCVTKVRVTLAAELPSPDPKRTAPVRSKAETEVAIRNRSLTTF